MGEDYEKLFGGNVSLLVGGEPIGVPPVSDADFHIEQGEPQYKPLWPDGKGAFEVSFTAELKDDAPIVRFIRREQERKRKTKKKLLWAVTHGYKVGFKVFTEDKKPVLLMALTPRFIRHFFRKVPFVPQYTIYDKQGNVCKIKNKKKEMKIIKQGKKRVTARRLTCPTCGCVFEYERGDLHSDQREPQPWVFCPCCNSAIDVNWWKNYE